MIFPDEIPYDIMSGLFTFFASNRMSRTLEEFEAIKLLVILHHET